MTAAIYLNSTDLEEVSNLDNYNHLIEKYCKIKGYDLFMVIDFSYPVDSKKKVVNHKIIELAKAKLVDIIIIPSLYSLSTFLPESLHVICQLHQYGIKVECPEWENNNAEFAGNE